MSSYCSCHHHHHSPNPISAAPSCCTPNYTHCCSQPPHPHHDPLLDTFALPLQPQLPNHHSYPNNNQIRKTPHRNLQFQAQNLHSQLLGEDQLTLSLISSLLQRITTLESSLSHFYASSSNKRCNPSCSLREAAARVIQLHFRAYLVRRSRTLSLLQDLAFIKSRFNSLKSSISNPNHFNCGIVSQKAMDLLLKLDSIQGGDPLIKDGKRSISDSIVRFLEFIDGLAVKKHGHLSDPVRNVRFFRNSNKSRTLNSNRHFSVPQKELAKKLSERVEKIRGFSRVFDEDEDDVDLEAFQEIIEADDNAEEEENHRILADGKLSNSNFRNGVLVKSTCGKPRVKKTVSFAENENLCRIYTDSPEPVLKDGSLSDGSTSSDDHIDHVNYNKTEERKQTGEDTENGVFLGQKAASLNSFNGERNPATNLRS